MSMIPPAMVNRLRQQAERTMTSSVQVQRLTSSPDGEGGSTSSWSTIATVPGRIGPGQRQPVEQVEGGQLTAIQTWIVALPAETDVTEKDRLVSGGAVY